MTIEWRYGRMAVILLLLASCRPVLIPPPAPAPPTPTGAPESAPVPPPPDAVKEELRQREQVAAALTDQGRGLLDAGRVDAALRLFEQAVSQSPHYGPGYYYLAEAWLQKNNGPQAGAFHDQAKLYLRDQAGWHDRLERQGIEIARKISGLSIP
jgi:tetratricopeptide (TPR) repeat protein